jgi:hypothetical protein
MLLTSWYWIFYLLSICDSLQAILGIFGFGMLAFSVIIQIIFWISDEHDEPSAGTIKLKKWLFIISIPTLILWAMIPDKRDLVMIVVGGTVFNYVEKDSSLQQLPYELTSFMKEQIRSWKEELQGGKKLEDMTKEELLKKLKDINN